MGAKILNRKLAQGIHNSIPVHDSASADASPHPFSKKPHPWQARLVRPEFGVPMEAGNPNFCDFARPSFSVVCTFHTHKAERGTKIVLRLDILYSLPYAVLVFKTVARPILQHVGRKASPFPLPVRGG